MIDDHGLDDRNTVKPSLPHSHLITLVLKVDFAATKEIGETPAGVRRIANITGGTFSGEKLNGTVLPGADWAIARPDGGMELDVRLILQTQDGGLIYMNYQGRFLVSAEAMERFKTGAPLEVSEYSLAMVAKFECGAPRYQWLNDAVAVGSGRQSSAGVAYEIYQIT